MQDLMNVGYAVVALVTLSGGIGAGLFWASRKFAVEEDPRVTLLENVLPGANCGACGLAGCRAFAEHRVQNPDSGAVCPPGGNAVGRHIAELLGVEVVETVPMVAKLLCRGTHASAAVGGLYDGIEDCIAATMLGGSAGKLCAHGCLGLGTCIKTCKFDAIRRKDGIVEVDEDLCTGCGECISVCPQQVLALLPKGDKVYVACSNPTKGANTRNECMAGCIGCKKCEKACQTGAITVENFLASIYQDKCDRCGTCVTVCPVGSILQVSHQPPGASEPSKELAAAGTSASEA